MVEIPCREDNKFKRFSYADYAMQHWLPAHDMRKVNKPRYRFPIIEGYQWALEEFFKHILLRTIGLSAGLKRSRNLCQLADVVGITELVGYRHLFEKFDEYIELNVREPVDIAAYEALLDYLLEDSNLDLADTILVSLYRTAQALPEPADTK